MNACAQAFSNKLLVTTTKLILDHLSLSTFPVVSSFSGSFFSHACFLLWSRLYRARHESNQFLVFLCIFCLFLLILLVLPTPNNNNILSARDIITYGIRYTLKKKSAFKLWVIKICWILFCFRPYSQSVGAFYFVKKFVNQADTVFHWDSSQYVFWAWNKSSLATYRSMYTIHQYI